MRKRVAGIMRVKNEGVFIRDCIASCIDALDELVVVYNDCTDNSVEEIEKMAAKYPEKIRHYAYPYEVKAFNLTREEFEELRNAPEDDPRLLSTYFNFALSKVTADYVLKIDADQIYFTFKLKEWCDFLRNCKPEPMTLKVVGGILFQCYLSVYRRLSTQTGMVLPMMPSWLLKLAYPAYLSYAKYAFSHDQAAMALSGVNVLETDETLISMGHSSDLLLMLSPFNGVGDTIIFKMSDKVRFHRVVMEQYNRSSFSVIEGFIHPYKSLTFIGFFWKHVRTMRPGVLEKAKAAYACDQEAFLNISRFRELSYRCILKHSPQNIFLPFHRILFGFVYKANKKDLFDSLKNEPIGGAIKKSKANDKNFCNSTCL